MKKNSVYRLTRDQRHFEGEFLNLSLGRHLCCIYGNKQDQFAVIIPYFLIGLQKKERCVYIIDERTVKEVIYAFKKAGVDLNFYIQSKQFIFLTKEEAYLKGGSFNPGRMIALLKAAQREALKAGFKGLRVTGEMTWILTRLPGVEKFVEYESKLNYFFPRSKAIAICQYNEKRFSPTALLDVIYTHPTVIIHKKICANRYYLPPDFFLAKLKGQIKKEVYENIRRDLIEREELEKRQESAERRVKDLSMFPEQNPNPVMRIGSDGKLIYANMAARVIIALDERGRGPFEFDRVANIVKDLMKGKGRKAENVEINVGDKTYFLAIAPIKKSGYANVYALDITDRKKVEEEVKKFADLKTRFASIASHELRGNISMIQEGVGLVYDGVIGKLEDKQKETLGTVLKAVKRLTRLVNDILDFQKIVAGKQRFDFKFWNIRNIIGEIYETMHFLAEQKGLYFRLKLSEGLPDVRLDKDKIMQVLVNLVNNALNYTEQGGIEISTEKDEQNNAIHVSVRDTGLGIKQDDLSKIFESFQRLEGEKTHCVKGSGLGLAISKEIIDAHQGKIWVESEFGRGSIFHFTLPLL